MGAVVLQGQKRFTYGSYAFAHAHGKEPAIYINKVYAKKGKRMLTRRNHGLLE